MDKVKRIVALILAILIALSAGSYLLLYTAELRKREKVICSLYERQ